MIRTAATQSVPYMRQLWDGSEPAAQAAVEKAGVTVTQVDRAASQKVSAPLLAAYLSNPDLQQIYQQIRAVA